MGTNSAAYHLGELEIAQNANHPRRIQPAIYPDDRRILDVGCGAGQTLIASGIVGDVTACGVDVDWAALTLGRSISSSILFVCARGEALPFRKGAFDLLICRVALPYMHIPHALYQFAQVLRAGGRLWLVLHPPSLGIRELREAVTRGEVRALVSALGTLANGLLLHGVGVQGYIPLRHHPYESVQTEAGMRRALGRSGFCVVEVHNEPHFVITATRLPE
jgi:SAM-dependent methyltransferase